ncbi:hypothetical protein [Noviherbaspirillum aridicola]|uniref:Uncharacterized protein n=1 Tax=Noviherbaspirillum aridicola TaxID=2849687 RepID=A0ABQ4Q0F5_9BURK|nr:hypothetical protein [Noviherbaspirillum aridicola]GIZ50516.1 hypothetical protein NCCP691_05300 [Noviherbaspirillum aridicola]
MKYALDSRIATRSPRVYENVPLMVGLAAGIAMIAGVALMRGQHRTRRYGDHAMERRRPANMFAAGIFPRRRRIDQTGTHPLFERRQDAYEG